MAASVIVQDPQLVITTGSLDLQGSAVLAQLGQTLSSAGSIPNFGAVVLLQDPQTVTGAIQRGIEIPYVTIPADFSRFTFFAKVRG
jgi:hypothetical protein